MKQVVSISLGSSARNATGTLRLGEKTLQLQRIGTDGDKEKAARLLQEYDGKAAALGLGGTDLYLWAGDKRYTFRESARLAAGVRHTPVLDGSGLKNTLERMLIKQLAAKGILSLKDEGVLLMCAVDRFGMAEALVEQQAKVVFGDIIFGLGVDIPLHSLGALQRAAALLVPIITKLPISWFYPTGDKQLESTPRGEKYFAESKIIAGDFLFIKRFMPKDLSGKIIITNTVTDKDRRLLTAAGVKTLITTTPRLQGRSFGTNVLEAALVAASGRDKALSPREYADLIEKYGLTGSVEDLTIKEF